MKILRRTDRRAGATPAADEAAEAGARRRLARLLCAAAVLHLTLSAAVFALGRYSVFPAVFDANGVAVAFAPDGVRYRADAAALSEILRSGELRAWLAADRPLHVKLYSVCFALFGPLSGYNVLGAWPLDAVLYLSCLTLIFNLGREVFGRHAGLAAACAVAVWPSFLLHTTQLLKDPLYVAGTLALVLLVTRWLTRDSTWTGALLSGAAGGLVVTVLWLVRSGMGETLTATVILGALALAARQLLERRLLAANLVGMALLLTFTFAAPRVMRDALELGRSPSSVRAHAIQEAEDARAQTGEATQSGFTSNAAARVRRVRSWFVLMYPGSGSNVDADVRLNDAADLLRYTPRAAEIGFFAPFPNMWLARGRQVGGAGRLLGGAESLAMYCVEALALFGLWKARRRPAVWFIFSVAAAGIVALGLVVVNVGTLYRLRYVFVMLLIVLAAGGFARLLKLPSGPARRIDGGGAEA